MFLDDTACNLASLNLFQFRRDDNTFDTASFEHAVRLWTITLEISVLMAQFPSARIAKLSHEFPASRNPNAYTVEDGFRLIAYRISAVYRL